MNASNPRPSAAPNSWLNGMRQGSPRRTKHIQPYDRFVKVAELLEAAQTVWTVWQTIDLPGLPAHVKLVQERAPHRSLTVSVSALTDRRYYRSIGPGRPAQVSAPEAAAPDGEHISDVATPGAGSAGEQNSAQRVPSRLIEFADRGFEGARAANLVPFTRSSRELARGPALAGQM